jgi:hypothetical protein
MRARFIDRTVRLLVLLSLGTGVESCFTVTTTMMMSADESAATCKEKGGTVPQQHICAPEECRIDSNQCLNC